MSDTFLTTAALQGLVHGAPLDCVEILGGTAIESRMTVGMSTDLWTHVYHALRWSQCSCPGCQELTEVFTEVLRP